MIKLKDGTKRLLRAEEIECRVGQRSKDGNKYSVLLYKTARTDADILDEVFGRDNWKATHYEVKGKDFCMIEVRTRFEDDTKVDPSGKYFCYEWVGKSDCGSESNIEAQKGESSDAFKRAGFLWGIGRELYSAPQIWLSKDVNAYDLQVSEIAYDYNDKISRLVLSAKDEVVYQFPRTNATVKQEKPNADKPQIPDHETLEKIRDIVEKLEFEGKNVQEILDYYHAKTIGEIPLVKWEKMLAKVRGEV